MPQSEISPSLALESVFPAVPESVAASRRFVRAALCRAGVDGDCVSRAVLLVSELVTNALVHASGSIHVRVAVGTTRVRVEVGDEEPELSGVAPAADLSAEAVSGRGLRIVEAVAQEWAIRPGRHGKTVWFELDRR